MIPRAVHWQAGRHPDGYPVIACGTDMLAVPRVAAVPEHVTCESCRRTRAWRDAAYRAATGRAP